MRLGLTQYIPFIIYGIFWIILLVTIFAPRVSFYYLILVLHFPQIKNKVVDLPLGTVFIEILLLVTIISVIIRKREGMNRNSTNISIHKILIIYIAYSFLSLMIGTHSLGHGFPFDLNDTRFSEWVNFVTIFLMFFLSYHLLDPEKDAKYILTLIFVLITIFWWRFYSDFRYVSKWHYTDTSRVTDVLGKLGPNELGAFFASYSMIAIGMLLKDENKIRRLSYAVVVFFGLYGMIYSYSRGAYLGFLMGIFILLLKEKRILLIPLVVGLIFWKSLLPVSVVERIQMTVSTQDNGGEGGNMVLEHSAASRFEFADAGLEMFFQSPLVGKGLFTFQKLSPYKMDAHNIYVKTLAETGVVGIFLLSIILFSLLITAYSIYIGVDDPIWKGIAIGFLACSISFIIGNMFGDRWSYTPLTSNLFVMLGLLSKKIAVMENYAESSISEPEVL